MDRSFSILIVDDVQLLRSLAKSYFTSSEFQLTTARNVVEGIRLANAIQPHLIIMDADMPGEDGVSGCRQIKNHPALFTTPVILVAANTPEAIEACWQAGCDAVLPRPLSRRELLAVSRQLLALADRAAPRVEHRILVHYGETSDLGWHDYAHNVGSGGFFLATERDLPAGLTLQLEFLIPGAPEATVCCGRVAWHNTATKALRPDLPPGVGIEFIDLSGAARRLLQGFILDATRHRPIAARGSLDGAG
jgi:CheY-like chemotaxis protein/Tfp pilus assembly protein PilZ